MRSLIIASAALLLVSTALPAQTLDSTSLALLEPGHRIRVVGMPDSPLASFTAWKIFGGGLFGDAASGRVRGTVISTSMDSLSFLNTGRRTEVTFAWASFERVEVHTGFDPARGALKGAGLGTLAGMAMVGAARLMFPPDQGWELHRPERFVMIWTIGFAGLGAATMGDRWRQVYPEK